MRGANPHLSPCAPTVARPSSVIASRTTPSVLPPACTTPGVATASPACTSGAKGRCRSRSPSSPLRCIHPGSRPAGRAPRAAGRSSPLHTRRQHLTLGPLPPVRPGVSANDATSGAIPGSIPRRRGGRKAAGLRCAGLRCGEPDREGVAGAGTLSLRHGPWRPRW
jgi:hypothetical protein